MAESSSGSFVVEANGAVIRGWLEVTSETQIPQQAICAAWVRDGRILAAVAFFHYTTNTMTAAIAGPEHPRALVRVIKWGLDYAFRQVGVKALTFFTHSANIRSIALTTKLGAIVEATLPDVWPDGDQVISRLYADKVNWSVVRVKESQNPTTT